MLTKRHATPSWPANKRIVIVVDTSSWFDSFAEELVSRLSEFGHDAVFARSYDEVRHGDIAFYLSCMRLTPANILARNHWNFVVHASALPKGRGFSPLVWQILEGASEIPITMITMAKEADAGEIVMQRVMPLAGHELNDELRRKVGTNIVEMCVELANQTTPATSQKQKGEATWYRRRFPSDSRISTSESLADQFELLRVVDNERYPAFFDFRDRRYVLRIEDLGPTSSFSEDQTP